MAAECLTFKMHNPDMANGQYPAATITCVLARAMSTHSRAQLSETHDSSNSGDFHYVVLFGTAPWHKERTPHHAIIVVPHVSPLPCKRRQRAKYGMSGGSIAGKRLSPNILWKHPTDARNMAGSHEKLNGRLVIWKLIYHLA